MVLEFPDTSPLRLSGAWGPVLAVHAAWRVHGVSALAAHPGMAALQAG